MSQVDIDAMFRRIAEAKGNDVTVTKEELTQLLRELHHFQGAAAYLASCHAATAEYDGSLKSTSTGRKQRYASICEKASQLLQGACLHAAPSDQRAVDAAIERCNKAAATLKTK